MGWLGIDGRRRPVVPRRSARPRVGQPAPAPVRLRLPGRLSRRRGGRVGLARARGIHRLGRGAGVRRRVEPRPARGALRPLPLHRGHRGRELYLSNVPFFDPAVLHLPRVREPGPGRAAPGVETEPARPPGGARLRAGRAGRAPHDVARRRDRSPGGPGRPVVPRPDLLLSGARLVLRGPGGELRRVGGRRGGRSPRLAGSRLARPRRPAGLGPALAGARPPGGRALLPRAGLQPGDHGGGGRGRRSSGPACLLHVPLAAACSILSTIAEQAEPATRAWPCSGRRTDERAGLPDVDRRELRAQAAASRARRGTRWC